jgi:hypothetical protein
MSDGGARPSPACAAARAEAGAAPEDGYLTEGLRGGNHQRAERAVRAFWEAA